jgi:hypothetical protein
MAQNLENGSQDLDNLEAGTQHGQPGDQSHPSDTLDGRDELQSGLKWCVPL